MAEKLNEAVGASEGMSLQGTMNRDLYELKFIEAQGDHTAVSFYDTHGYLVTICPHGHLIFEMTQWY